MSLTRGVVDEVSDGSTTALHEFGLVILVAASRPDR
jgi:hypothetical protein